MQIAVIGAANATPEESEIAYAVGSLIAKTGATLICGGLGGVMEAACRGAREAGGMTVGIVPDAGQGNRSPWHRHPFGSRSRKERLGLPVSRRSNRHRGKIWDPLRDRDSAEDGAPGAWSLQLGHPGSNNVRHARRSGGNGSTGCPGVHPFRGPEREEQGAVSGYPLCTPCMHPERTRMTRLP